MPYMFKSGIYDFPTTNEPIFSKQTAITNSKTCYLVRTVNWHEYFTRFLFYLFLIIYSTPDTSTTQVDTAILIGLLNIVPIYVDSLEAIRNAKKTQRCTPGNILSAGHSVQWPNTPILYTGVLSRITASTIRTLIQS